ncbi:hypothetical protein QIQ36_gp3 [ssRNA phage SRR5466727_9]|uniref:Uncharacterized protein n=1 Tax=ssRNA phage SRR5466727_9 TaxID=2786438 RepID=A0A8S5L072_9VIRU|nr:hypothetical protein QIQ36_gp3 [ssRNA phage SRR5466727_9]DAD50839.1 TPA_asm: hypothetical protein [ssRNA phage SRR5466727_9]
MTNENSSKGQEDFKYVLDILNLVRALASAYQDIRRSLKSDRKVSRRVRQMRSNLLAVLEADKHARSLGDAFEAGPHDASRGVQLDLPFTKVNRP